LAAGRLAGDGSRLGAPPALLGKGYATEAAKAALDYGFANYPVTRLVSLIAPENHASQRVAERLGETRGAPVTLTIFGRSFVADCWEIRRPG
jgi:RimJ/RimL family protein N-acetyltransferase